MDLYNLVSFIGVFGLVFVAWLFSANPRVVNWRAIACGILLQLVLGALVFWLPGSTRAFLWLNDLVLRLLSAATAGQRFVFGVLALPPGATGAQGEKSLGFILAVQALPIIVFVAALMGLLYYCGIMQRVVRAFAWVFSRLMRVSGAESLVTASNIFVGIESATAVRPYLAAMTPSEFCTLLTAGMATVAASTMGMYVLFLSQRFPTIAGHLISASLMSAPAAIVMSKVLVPESGEPATLGHEVRVAYERETSAFEAIINGAMAGARMVLGIVALLIAFLGLVALADLVLEQLGAHAGAWLGITGKWSLAGFFGYAFAPLAAMTGIAHGDLLVAGQLFGERLVATEVPAYLRLAELMAGGVFTHPRSPVVIAYVLCGFAHVASMAIFVGGTAALVPERRADLARVGPRALLAASLACLQTGAVAGTFFHDPAIILRG